MSLENILFQLIDGAASQTYTDCRNGLSLAQNIESYYMYEG